MKRILFDTSVYGELITDHLLIKKLQSLRDDEHMVFYGSKTIRNELRKTSTDRKVGNKKLRILLLSLYDSLIKDKHSLQTTELIKLVADKYFEAYHGIGGGYSKHDIANDFLIVACASLHNLDILVSNDEKSMLGDKAIASYKKVNKIFQLNNPYFIHYKEFKKEVQTSL